MISSQETWDKINSIYSDIRTLESEIKKDEKWRNNDKKEKTVRHLNYALNELYLAALQQQ